MKSSLKLAGLLIVPAILAACASLQGKPAASATLEARSGSQARGVVSLYETREGVRVVVRASGLTPGQHGFHVHEAGDCSAPDASSAKGHFNPMAHPHGDPAGSKHHLGDLPNLLADAKGEASYEHVAYGLTLGGSQGIIGRSFVIHADPDDYQSQPAGNSGKRVACGVIVAQ